MYKVVYCVADEGTERDAGQKFGSYKAALEWIVGYLFTRLYDGSRLLYYVEIREGRCVVRSWRGTDADLDSSCGP